MSVNEQQQIDGYFKSLVYNLECPLSLQYSQLNKNIRASTSPQCVSGFGKHSVNPQQLVIIRHNQYYNTLLLFTFPPPPVSPSLLSSLLQPSQQGILNPLNQHTSLVHVQSPPVLSPVIPNTSHNSLSPINNIRPLSEVPYLNHEQEYDNSNDYEITNGYYEELILSEDSLSENSYCFSDQQLLRLGIDSDFFSKIPQHMKQDVIESAFLLQQHNLQKEKENEQQRQAQHYRLVKEQILSIQESYLLDKFRHQHQPKEYSPHCDVSQLQTLINSLENKEHQSIIYNHYIHEELGIRPPTEQQVPDQEQVRNSTRELQENTDSVDQNYSLDLLDIQFTHHNHMHNSNNNSNNNNNNSNNINNIHDFNYNYEYEHKSDNYSDKKSNIKMIEEIQEQIEQYKNETLIEQLFCIYIKLNGQEFKQTESNDNNIVSVMRTLYILCHNLTNQVTIIQNIFFQIQNHKHYCLYLLLEYLAKKPLVQKQIYQLITQNNDENSNEIQIEDQKNKNLLSIMLVDIQEKHQFKNCIIEIIKQLVRHIFSEKIGDIKHKKLMLSGCLIQREIKQLCNQFYYFKCRLDYDENSFYRVLSEFCRLPHAFTYIYQHLIHLYSQDILSKLVKVHSLIKAIPSNDQSKSIDSIKQVLDDHQQLPQEFHTFRHIIKDLNILHKKSQDSLLKYLKQKHGDKLSLEEEEEMKEQYLSEIRGKVYNNSQVKALFSLALDTVELLVSLIGVDFEQHLVEDIYHYFLYLLKPFLILKQYLSQSYKPTTSLQQLCLSRLKTSSQEDSIRPIQPVLQDDDLFNLTYQRLYGTVSAVIGTFMRMKPHQKIDNYMYYIEQAPDQESLSIKVKFSYMRAYAMKVARGETNGISEEPFIDLCLTRANLWRDSYQQLRDVAAKDWVLKQLRVSFEGEEGSDYGGVTREWLSLMARQVFNQDRAYFSSTLNGQLQPSSLASININSAPLYRFLGMLLAKALISELNFEVEFSEVFIKHLLHKQLYMTDLNSLDQQLAQNLQYLLNNDVSSLGLYFQYEIQVLDKYLTIDLVEDGGQVEVTELNKKQYVKKVAELLMSSNMQYQITAFKQGFLSLIPEEALRFISHKDMMIKLSGIQTIDLTDMQAHTTYSNYSSTDIQIIWFWKYLHSIDNCSRANLLFFITGSYKVPYGGFAQFKIKIDKLHGDNENLPVSHTCFNQLDLPVYTSYDQLVDKTNKALEYAGSGFYLC